MAQFSEAGLPGSPLPPKIQTQSSTDPRFEVREDSRSLAEAEVAAPSLRAILLILIVFATIVGLGAAISGPAEAWINKLPEGVPRLQERLSFLNAPINALRTFLAAANNFGAAGPQRSSAGPLDSGAILSSVFVGTRSFASGLFATVMFLYFLLVSGDSFLRRLVEVLPRFASKRQAVDISQQIERDISAYLVTITLMNALVGARR